MELPQFVQQTEPGAVFTLLADDNRVDILRALWRADGPMSFSELHELVDIADSGQFNYHLDKLVDHFVAATDEGYELTEAGRQINGALKAGTYTTTGSIEPIELERSCPACGGVRTFHYEDEQARVDCDGCEVVAGFSIPPSAFVGADRADVVDIAGRYLQTLLFSLENGFCSRCDGPVERRVTAVVDAPGWEAPEEGSPLVEHVDDLPIVQYECLQCGIEPSTGLTLSLLTHPAVVGFYHDRDVDIRKRSVWEVTHFGPDRERVRSREPFRASVTFTAAGDELTVVVDEHLAVVELD